jgi:hypothetical protein
MLAPAAMLGLDQHGQPASGAVSRRLSILPFPHGYPFNWSTLSRRSTIEAANWEGPVISRPSVAPIQHSGSPPVSGHRLFI